MPPRRRVGPQPGLAHALPHDSAISSSLPTCQSSGDITLYARHTKRQTVSRPEDPCWQSFDDLRVRCSVADRSRPRSKKHSATLSFRPIAYAIQDGNAARAEMRARGRSILRGEGCDVARPAAREAATIAAPAAFRIIFAAGPISEARHSVAGQLPRRR
jgi:hypothetical protein